MKNLSNWRSVRLLETRIETHLRRERALWFHGWCIGFIVLATMGLFSWGMSQFVADGPLALRYVLDLGVGYVAYLAAVRIWAARLVDEDRTRSKDWGLDLPTPGSGGPGGGGGSGGSGSSIELPSIKSGGGGDFGGAGASGDFGSAADAGSILGDGGSAIGDMGSALGDVAGGLDVGEGAIVVIPVLLVFLAGVLLFMGVGSLLYLYFGWEVLLAVAIELGFGYVSARTFVLVEREGWLSAAVRLTWKPLLAAVICAVLLGALIDWLVPQARSLPDAVRIVRGGHR